jgi:membrane-associated phospholipid phosphatase
MQDSPPHTPPEKPDLLAETPLKPHHWYEPAPQQFDLVAPAWVKLAGVGIVAWLAMIFVDVPVTQWAHAHPIPDAMKGMRTGYGDISRDLMFLEQWGQIACSCGVVVAVFLLDKAGRRRAASIAVACLWTVLVTHLLKDILGRSRPYIAAHDGTWVWGGPAMGFHKGAAWGSFPSAHTTAAFALASSLSWFYPRGRLLFMTLATITATQRVLHCAHYVSDTIAGMGIGVLVARTTLASKLVGRSLNWFYPQWAREWWLQDR